LVEMESALDELVLHPPEKQTAVAMAGAESHDHSGR
jgi:hypothetical protein